MAYTPGPWTVVNHNWRETSVVPVDSDHSNICGLDLSYDDETSDEQIERLQDIQAANAKLIAAAPVLLNVLREVKNRYASLMTQKMQDNIDQAIKKATE